MRNVTSRNNNSTDYIALAEFKNHLRVTSSDDDAYLSTLLNSCFDFISNYIGYELRKSNVDYFFDSNYKLHIPAMILSLTSVKYRDVNGDIQTLAPTNYDKVLTISANYGYDITIINPPSLYAYGWKYKVSVVEGFGKQNESIDVSKIFPDDIKAAIYLLGEHWYTQRGSVIVGATSSDIPFGHEYLLSKYSIKEFV